MTAEKHGANGGSTTADVPWFVRPTSARLVLAAFLEQGELEGLVPLARTWAEPLQAAAHERLGRAHILLQDRPESGSGITRIVDEPEAFTALCPFAQSVPTAPNAHISWAWVELANLVAVAATADPIPEGPLPQLNDVGALANYSLAGPHISVQMLPNQAWLHASAAVNLRLTRSGVEPGGLMTVQYKVEPVPQPILVGFESGRLYLVTQYGRVLRALQAGISQLICLVHYGLDFDASDLGMGGISLGTAPNQFGRARLQGPRVPLVKDFLDARLTVEYPTRPGTYFANIIKAQVVVDADVPPEIDLPLGVRAGGTGTGAAESLVQ